MDYVDRLQGRSQRFSLNNALKFTDMQASLYSYLRWLLSVDVSDPVGVCVQITECAVPPREGSCKQHTSFRGLLQCLHVLHVLHACRCT